MTARNPNLLLDPSAAPVAGFQYTNVIMWYGGPLDISLTGNATYGGATVDYYACTKLPPDGNFYAPDGITKQVQDSDWIKLNTDALAADAIFQLTNLNPCLLIAKVTAPAVGTRLRAVASPSSY